MTMEEKLCAIKWLDTGIAMKTTPYELGECKRNQV